MSKYSRTPYISPHWVGALVITHKRLDDKRTEERENTHSQVVKTLVYILGGSSCVVSKLLGGGGGIVPIIFQWAAKTYYTFTTKLEVTTLNLIHTI